MDQRPDVQAHIEWRRKPPTTRYAAPARFDGDSRWPNEAWSLVVEPFSVSGTYIVRFLVPEAPHHLLFSGARFTLYEGPQEVATGTIA